MTSGNTVHHRLNRYGDRQLNGALHTIVMARMRTDATTIVYVEKRTKDGMSKRDIKRSLKRYVARSLFKKLEACNVKP
ncbi:MAG TPA: transposase [Candidatus Binatia bacterium]|jgi:transposase|nr:transposase [Candidatus Binatia bacterium]